MKQIPLSRGQVAFVDDEDFDTVAAHRWHFNNYGYAQATVYEGKKKRSLYMHRLILNAPKGVEVDHKNGIKIDNTRSNLRYATSVQQKANTRQRKDAMSAYKGVGRKGDKYVAKIRKHGQHFFLGCFDKPWKAALAYDAKARVLFGEFAKLNFPNMLADENLLNYWRREDRASQQPGVSYYSRDRKWIAYHKIDGKAIIHRTFATEAEAIAAVQAAIAAYQTARQAA